jgi:hypothetical protein
MATARLTMSRKVTPLKVTTSRPKPVANVQSLTPIPRAPVAPAAPSPTPFNPNVLPPDAAYEQQIGALGAQRDTTLAGLATERQGGLLGYGYTQDQSGELAFDPNNPYSRAAVLKRHYDESRRGSGTSLAAQGQLYSGAYQTAQDYGNQQELQSSDALQKQLLAFLGRNTASAAQAGSAYETGVGAAGSDRLSRAIEAYRAMIAAGGA